MFVLIACEYSGIVREAFRALGHNAISCDLLPTEIEGPHIVGDVLPWLGKNKWNNYQGWDLIIAFPPCTDLAVSGTQAFERKKQSGEQQASKEFFMKFVDAPCDRICIENPIGIMSTEYRAPDQIIHPYYFGDPMQKATCLWLKGLPKLKPTNVVEPVYLLYNSKKNKSGTSKYSVFGKLGKGKGKERSKSPVPLLVYASAQLCH